jgi:hypothetical protein
VFDDADRAVDVVDVEQALDVGAGQPELTGGAEEVGDRRRRVDEEGRSWRGRLDLGAVLEADREGALREGAFQLDPQRRRLREQAAPGAGVGFESV